MLQTISCGISTVEQTLSYRTCWQNGCMEKSNWTKGLSLVESPTFLIQFHFEWLLVCATEQLWGFPTATTLKTNSMTDKNSNTTNQVRRGCTCCLLYFQFVRIQTKLSCGNFFFLRSCCFLVNLGSSLFVCNLYSELFHLD